MKVILPFKELVDEVASMRAESSEDQDEVELRNDPPTESVQIDPPSTEITLAKVPTPATPPHSDSLLREKEAEILFLKRTNEGILAETKQLQAYATFCNANLSELHRTNSDLQNSYQRFQLDAEKDSSNFSSKINELQQKLNELTTSTGNFVQHQAKSRKPYHDLCPAQKSVVHKDLRENLVPELDTALKKRKLRIDKVVFADTEGKRSAIKIDGRPKHTYNELSPIELETVAAVSDTNSIYRTSHAAYASKRRLIKDLPSEKL